MQVIETAAATIKEVWDYQHPVMDSWFLVIIGVLCFLLFNLKTTAGY